MSRSSIQKHCIEIDLLRKSCQEVFYINLAKRAFIESLYGDLIKRYSHEISYRDLVQEVLPRDFQSCPAGLAKRPLKEIYALCREICYKVLVKDLARTISMEILYKGMVKRAEVFLGDHVQIAWTERYYFAIPYKRSSVEIPCRHLLQVGLHWGVSQQLLPCARSSAIFTKVACRICPGISSPILGSCGPASLQPLVVLGAFHFRLES